MEKLESLGIRNLEGLLEVQGIGMQWPRQRGEPIGEVDICL